jgi:hypothetical protein
MFFSNCARYLPRTEILIVGILIEKGAASKRGVVLKTSRIVAASGKPMSIVDRAVSRLILRRILMRQPSGRNFEYRVSLREIRRLKQPIFRDRTSLTARTGVPGYGRVPYQMRLLDEDKTLSLTEATLHDLVKLQEQKANRKKNYPRKNGEPEQIGHLVELMRPYDAKRPGITLGEVFVARQMELDASQEALSNLRPHQRADSL